MIGNDIIDLSLARAEMDILRPRVWQKIFTETEQQSLTASADKRLLAWIYWSMKESAYKIINRNIGRRFYAPLALEASLRSPVAGSQSDVGWPHSAFSVSAPGSDAGLVFSGMVAYQGDLLFTRTVVRVDFLHTVSLTTDSFLNVVIRESSGFEYSDLIAGRRQAELEKLLAGTDKLFRKDSLGLPFLASTLNSRIQAVSLSHHGKYIGMTWNRLADRMTSEGI